ncbi:hypothetical protein TcBrA4_0019810 [Trypanosoma cruzi]|nr:hypothetical protein TcBrA4_0019810 [Trypanosoma cruzi]
MPQMSNLDYEYDSGDDWDVVENDEDLGASSSDTEDEEDSDYSLTSDTDNDFINDNDDEDDDSGRGATAEDGGGTPAAVKSAASQGQAGAGLQWTICGASPDLSTRSVSVIEWERLGLRRLMAPHSRN